MRRGEPLYFLVKECGYDEASASLRERAIRVLESLPEVEHKLEERTLSVSTVAQAETFFRQEAKRKQAPCTAERKREILGRLEHCSKREAERVLAEEAPHAPRPDHRRVISGGQTEIRFTADAELEGLLEQVKERSSHRKLEAGLNGLFKFMAKEVLRKLDPAREPERKARTGKGRKQGEAPAPGPEEVQTETGAETKAEAEAEDAETKAEAEVKAEASSPAESLSPDLVAPPHPLKRPPLHRTLSRNGAAPIPAAVSAPSGVEIKGGAPMFQRKTGPAVRAGSSWNMTTFFRGH